MGQNDKTKCEVSFNLNSLCLSLSECYLDPLYAYLEPTLAVLWSKCSRSSRWFVRERSPSHSLTVIDTVLGWCGAERTLHLGRMIRATSQYIRMIWAIRQYTALTLKLSDSASPRRFSRHSATDTRLAPFRAKLGIQPRIVWCTEPRLYNVFCFSSIWRHVVRAYICRNGCEGLLHQLLLL